MDTNSECAGVRELEAAIRSVGAAMMHIDNSPGSRVLAGTAVFGQMQLMVLHAQAIEATAASEHALTSSAHLRPMMLAWSRIIALFREPDPNAAAIMSMRQTCVDRLAQLREADPETGEVGRLEKALELMQSVANGGGQQAPRGTRSLGRGGQGSLIENARAWLKSTPEVLAEFDDALAEADCAGPTPVMVADSDGNERVIYLAFSDNPDESANRICYQASRILVRSWEQIARAFGITPAPTGLEQ